MDVTKHLPPLGHRLIKTAVAVFICLLFHWKTGNMATVSQSYVAAIVCMLPSVTDSKSYAFERIQCTVLGMLWGFFFIFLINIFRLGRFPVVTYTLMAFVMMLSMYSAIAIKRSGSAALVAMIFLGIVVNYPNSTTPKEALYSVMSTLFGVIVAILVNIFHMPRERHPEKLFFVNSQDLVPDRHKQIPSSVNFMLDYLYNDGAKICVISRFAPAFIVAQMGLLKVNAPIIVMDGSALFDIADRKYLDVIEIPHDNADRLTKIITDFGACCSIYAVQNQSLCIYLAGELSDAEKLQREKMRKSPYRNYLDGSYTENDKITIIRVLDTPERIARLEYLVKSVLPPKMFRMEVRTDTLNPAFSGIYFYDISAGVPEMKKRVHNLMERRYGFSMTPIDMNPLSKRYMPEHDALLLLNRLKCEYEPMIFSRYIREWFCVVKDKYDQWMHPDYISYCCESVEDTFNELNSADRPEVVEESLEMMSLTGLQEIMQAEEKI